MKANAIPAGNCKLAPGCLATISIYLVDSRIIKTAGVQHDYVITTWRRPFDRPDGHHGLLWKNGHLTSCVVCSDVTVIEIEVTIF